jgi:hypothetical protein
MELATKSRVSIQENFQEFKSSKDSSYLCGMTGVCVNGDEGFSTGVGEMSQEGKERLWREAGSRA